ncbi:hypothetical protein GCM10009654_45970 [Streptomyces hebeiensis]|uniref:Uncharacterized protein n=1 Tax=Streptomyces hebeiensis TaxID=229486 RepID=A0ABP4FIX3_9ACTN
MANRGKPFGGKNVKDRCGIALSSKRAGAGIGHEGVGFKSVPHLCDAPEVYSVAREGRRGALSRRSGHLFVLLCGECQGS